MIQRYVRDENGKKHWYQGKNERELAEARARLVARLKQESRPVYTFRAWTAEWQSVYRARESAPMRKDTDGRLERYVYPLIGARFMTEIRPIDIQRIFASTADKSASFQHKLHTTLGQIFRAAEDNGVIDKTPMRGVPRPKGSAGQRRALTEDERSALLAACTGDTASLLCLLSLYCGLRPAESAALMWSDVDTKRWLLHVNKALKRDGTIGAPKSAAGVRTVPVPKPIREYLSGGVGLVLQNSYGGALTRTSIRALWLKMKKRMGAPDDLSLYCLRHTYATDLEAAGVPLNVAKTLMGHDNVTVTAKIYTHTGAEAIEQARVLIDKKAEKGK